MGTARSIPAEFGIGNRYYAEFRGQTFVIQAEAEAVERPETMQAVLDGIRDLLEHRIGTVLVFGKGLDFEAELGSTFHAQLHPETHRLVIPEAALPAIARQRARIARDVATRCRTGGLPYAVLGHEVIRAERRIGHEATGVLTAIDLAAVRSVLDAGKLAVLGFGGRDDRGQFLHVPSVPLAADLAVALEAQKLLFLTAADGITIPDGKGGRRQLSFADLEELLCLLPRRDAHGQLLLTGPMVSRVHASIRAVAGNVRQVHLVSYSRWLDEILTRTGVGTMIERQQSHQVDYARPEDIEEIHRLHRESQQYTTRCGTPLVKPLDRSALQTNLAQTLVLKHREVLVGKLHVTDVPGVPQAVQIGGLVIAENHQDSQQGLVLVSEALRRLRGRGYATAVAVTASERAQRLFERMGGSPAPLEPWQTRLLEKAQTRYAPEERDEVMLFRFSLVKRLSPS